MLQDLWNNFFSGYDLIEWLMDRLSIEDSRKYNFFTFEKAKQTNFLKGTIGVNPIEGIVSINTKLVVSNF